MEKQNEPAVYYMEPFLGVPWVEVFDAPPDYDARKCLHDMMQSASKDAEGIRCRGTRSQAARNKARLERKASLLFSALDKWDPRRIKWEGKKLLISLAQIEESK